MKNRCANGVLAVCAGIIGCAAPPFSPNSGDPAVHKVSVSGESYSISQLTASTWTATAAGSSKVLAKTAAGAAGLRQAIEKASGCKVTDSDYSRDGSQFDAQVDCGGSRP